MTEEKENLISDGKVMSLFDHLSELRVRLVKSLVVLVVIFGVCIFQANAILNILKVPLQNALPPGMNALHFTNPMDVFFVQLRVAFVVSIIISCPVWLYQFWKFFEPALYPRERKHILPFVVSSVLLFCSGIAFCYFVMLPIALKFLISMGLEVGTPMITINDYVELLTILFLGFGLVFETPLILVLLSMLGIITSQTLTEYRRFIIIGILVVAALLTPPDPISQFIMAIPMYLMFEAAIVIIRFIERSRAKSA